MARTATAVRRSQYARAIDAQIDGAAGANVIAQPNAQADEADRRCEQHDDRETCHPADARGGLRMAPRTNEELVRRWADAIGTDDDAALGALRHPDWTMDW